MYLIIIILFLLGSISSGFTPPKPHAFANIPLQSGLSESKILIVIGLLASTFMCYPIKIICTVSLFDLQFVRINSVIVVMVVSLISFLGLIIVSFTTKKSFPSKLSILLRFMPSIILLGILYFPSFVGAEWVIHAIQSKVIELLVALNIISGLVLHFFHYGQLMEITGGPNKIPDVKLSNITNMDNASSNSSSNSNRYSAREITQHNYSKELLSYSKNVNTRASNLQESNLLFEDYFSRAQEARARGDQINDLHFTNLARLERDKISNGIVPLELLINSRSNLAAKADSELIYMRFSKNFCNNDADHFAVLSISKVLAYNNTWNI